MKDVAKVGWENAPLGHVCKFMGGGTPSKQNPSFWGGELPWVSPKDMKSDTVSDSIDHVTDIAVEQSATKRIPKGAILIVVRSGILSRTIPTAIAGRELTVNQDLKAIIPDKRLDGRFLAYFFQAAEPYLLDRVTRGATVHKLDMPVIKSLPVPLPPLEEQQRIVAVLDEAFEGLARARTHAEANLQNARELFETALSAFIERHKDSWSSTTLGEAYDVRDGTHDSPKYHPTGRALITSKNLGRDGLHFEKIKFISEEDYVSICKRSGVDKGDVLFAMIGTIGNPIVVDVEPDFAIKNVALFKMKDGRSGQFLRYMLRSKYVVEKMRAEAKGTTQQFVGLGYLRAFPVILPDPTTEMTMVDELDRIEAHCRSAEALYDIKLQDIDDLRQSLLQKAFAGDLT